MPTTWLGGNDQCFALYGLGFTIQISVNVIILFTLFVSVNVEHNMCKCKTM